MPLRKKTAQGSLWNLLRTLSTNGIDFLVYVMLARILSIEDFALLIFCLLIVEFANMFAQIGAGQTLIQRHKWEHSFASSTFVFMATFGLGISILVAFVGATVGYFFHSELAAFVIVALSINPFLISMQSVLSAKLERDFKNAHITYISATSSIVSGGLAVVLVLYGAGLWSLVIQKVCHNLLLLLLLSLSAKFKPSLTIRTEHVQELYSFCLPLLGASIVQFTNRKAINLYAALILGANAFALISIAKKGQDVLSQSTMTPINKMIVPALSRVKHVDKVSALYRIIELTAFIVIPCFLGLGAVAPQFIELAFGEDFSTVAILLTISTSGIIASILSWFLGGLLISVAHTKSALHLNTLDLVATLLVGGVSAFFGLQIMLLSLVVSSYLLLPLKINMVSRYMPVNLSDMIKLIAPPTLASVIMVLCIKIVDIYAGLSSLPLIIELILLLITGTISYVAVLLTLFNQKTIQIVKGLPELLRP